MTFEYKNRPAGTAVEEFNRSGQEMGDMRLVTKKELIFLPSLLLEGEQVLAFTSGIMSGKRWFVVLTDMRILFLNKFYFFGLKQIIVDLNNVNAVSGETGIFSGRISIQDGAMIRTLDRVLLKTVLPFSNKLRDVIELRREANGNEKRISSSDDGFVSTMERLAILTEKGFLTREEFEMQKARLLRH
jgi:hypothetical protein